MPPKRAPLKLPSRVTRALVADRKAYFAAPDWLAEDEMAACQLRAHVR